MTTSINRQQGISLSVDQFNALVELLPQVESSLKAKGESVSRPSYGENAAKSAAPVVDDDEEAEQEEEAEKSFEDGPAEVQKPSSKLDKFKYTKKNHETTSDEED